MDRIEDSPLLSEINNKLDELGVSAYEIRVSITPEAEHFESKNGDTSYVKWLCWEISNEKEKSLFQSKISVVHSQLTKEVIESDLLKFFPEKLITVDNEIYLED